ncbi:MAG TPA: sigma-70 family RNA polymerase sigma factor [Dehalococcoidales bacterium]|nr:sigma-70 family RNA polymerase sigma factor [Dehalococcoidales bacterium]
MNVSICMNGGYLVQDEQDLVHRAQNGDKEAFTELYETYFGKLYRYVVARIGNRAEAEDMTQQVFVKAYKSISSYRWRGVPFSAWLFRIAHNLVVDFFRKESKRPTVPLEESLVASNDNVQQVVERRLDIERVMAATRQLTAAQREVVSLRFAGGLAIAEVARVMGKSEGAVKALQHSAIAALRRILLVGENGVKG